MVRRDVLRNMVRYNFGDAAAKLTPKVSLGEVQAEDSAKMVTAFSQAGYVIHPSQYAGIDRRLSLPARVLTPEEANPPPPEQGPPPANDPQQGPPPQKQGAPA